MAHQSVTTRSYLREADRRRDLLDATSRLVQRDGIEGVSMSALAREAGVSRRLVYDHFDDLSCLYDAYLDDRTQHYGTLFDQAIAASRDPSERAVAMFRQALRLPPEELRVVRMLVAGTGGAALERARDRFRTHVIDRWFDRATPRVNGTGGALVWAMAAAVLSVADQVGRGEVTEATGVFVVGVLTSPPSTDP